MSLTTGTRPGAAAGPATDLAPAPAPGGPMAPPPYRPRPSGPARWLPALATAVTVVGVIAITLWQLHPNLLLRDTSTTGGDTGAHYMLPQYLGSQLLAHGHLTGWDPAWYDGFPLYTFYFVLPDLWAALMSHVIGYNVAFKLATILGSVTMPVAAWACGRLFRLRPPMPAVLAAATLPYLFDYTWTIYGGNLFSTLAGEYAYSLSISLALLFLGLFARGLRTGRHRGWAAVVLALCVAAHLVPALFAMAGAGVLTAFELLPRRLRLRDGDRDPVRGPWQSLWWGATTVGLGLLLSGWWLVPFVAEQPYANSMGYLNVTTWQALLYPSADHWVLWMAGASGILALALRSRFGIFVAIMGGLSAAALVLDPQGSLYNTRFLPLWFLCVYVLAGWGFGTVVVAAARAWRRHQMSVWVLSVRRSGAGVAAWDRPPTAQWAPGAVVGPLLALAAVAVAVVPPFLVTDGALPASAVPVHVQAQVSEWAQYNYVGYEGQPGYHELQAIMALMRRTGEQDGCGRAMWEYNADLDRFGTPMALMLLPFYTGGCIDSMEGLLFESSATTPYHFLNQAELSVAPSEPMVGLSYGPVDVPLGVEHLQLLGVRYFLASSPEVQEAARADRSLVLLARIGPFAVPYNGSVLHTTWDLFEVKDSALVTPLRDQPAVLEGVGAGQNSWLASPDPQEPGTDLPGPSESWYLDPSSWAVELAAAGPSSWARIRPGAAPPKVKVPATAVSDISVANESLSFRVSRVGTPVLVKVSYFPNWTAAGAEGPWRVTPNLMVVVPTSHRVTLTYGTTGADRLGAVCTVAGLACVVMPAALRRLRRGGIRNRHRNRAFTAP